jgi:hypothetical protein
MHRRTFLSATTGLAALKADFLSRARAAAALIDVRKPEEAKALIELPGEPVVGGLRAWVLKADVAYA